MPIGRCSLCNGVVSKDLLNSGIFPALARCESCGATEARSDVPDKVIPMVKGPQYTLTFDKTTVGYTGGTIQGRADGPIPRN
jgi:uncharacterized Zn finger protein